MRVTDDPWQVREVDFPLEGTAGEKLRFLVSYAVLAPSSYNTQPWLFRIRGDALDVIADRRRALPVADPQDRELTISCGAALEFLCVALRYFGYAPEVTAFPDAGSRDVLARVRTGPRVATDSVARDRFQAMAVRRTARVPFHPDPIDGVLVERLRAAASLHGVGCNLVSNPRQRRAFASLVAKGDRAQFKDRRFRRELALWTHARRGPLHDGLPVSGGGMPEVLSPMESFVARDMDRGDQAATRDAEVVAHSPVLGLLHSEVDTVAAWLRVGRALGTMLLTATTCAIRSSFFNQPIQVEELRPEVANAAGVDGFPQVLLRFGYGPLVERTVRRPVHDVLVGG